MKQKLFFACIILLFGMHSLAANLVICKSDGTQQLQDIAVIGKLVFVEKNVVLLDTNGEVLAEEPIRGIRKIILLLLEQLLRTYKLIIFWSIPIRPMIYC